MDHRKTPTLKDARLIDLTNSCGGLRESRVLNFAGSKDVHGKYRKSDWSEF